MLKNKTLTFIKNEEIGFLESIKENLVFSCLAPFFVPADLEIINQVYSSAQTITLKVAELKEKLSFPKDTNNPIFSKENCTFIKSLFTSDNLTLNLPVLLKLSRKSTKKLIRTSFYYNSFNLLKEIQNKQLLQRDSFLFGLAENLSLLYCLMLPDDQQISIIEIDNLDELFNKKLMHAIRNKLQTSPDLLKPTSATLIMSEECNLRCIYCYEPHKKRSTEIMSFETAKNALRKFEKGSKVTFFGGEPMLHIELMKQICEWGWEYRNLNFEMITNGQIIDREFFRNYAKYFSYVQLSCDGHEIANDINRGHGSHKRIMDFMNVFYEETGKYPTLHPVLSKYSVPFLYDIVTWYYNIETANKSVTGNEIPTMRWLPGDAKDWDEDTFTEYDLQLEKLENWYLNNNIWQSPFKIRAYQDAESSLTNPNNEKSFKPSRGLDNPCSAGKTLFAVLPNGTLVPCHHEYWLPEEHRQWEIIGPADDPDGVNHMSQITLADIPKCNTCEQWGCCVCPGSFFYHSQQYTEPTPNWCRAGKMLINSAYRYLNKKRALVANQKNDLLNIATAVNYLLEENISKK